ncbi:S-layer homology domain-containing protein [Dermabacteraceae bacterium TAE3-ERU5]|nr:S-layer homology domain-containing protein [Dermabacteraceae bacterium TAE3-ERU5]
MHMDFSRRALLAGSLGLIGAATLPGAASAATVFRDVGARHRFRREIEWLHARGITKGWPDRTFRPGNNITREAFCAFLYRAQKVRGYRPPARSPFQDVKSDHPFYREISWAAQERIFRGWPDGKFRPRENITREAAVAVLHRLAGEPRVNPQAPFRDVPINHPFAPAISWAKANGIMRGWPDGTFRPKLPISREATAALLYRYFNTRPAEKPTLSALVLREVNAHRAKHGLKPLKPHAKIDAVAQAWSRQLLAQPGEKNLSHNPAYSRQIPGGWRASAENVLYRYEKPGTSAETLARNMVTQWMNSPGHRANILTPEFTHMGFGEAGEPSRSYPGQVQHYGTQNFATYR